METLGLLRSNKEGSTVGTSVEQLLVGEGRLGDSRPKQATLYSHWSDDYPSAFHSQSVS